MAATGGRDYIKVPCVHNFLTNSTKIVICQYVFNSFIKLRTIKLIEICDVCLGKRCMINTFYNSPLCWNQNNISVSQGCVNDVLMEQFPFINRVVYYFNFAEILLPKHKIILLTNLNNKVFMLSEQHVLRSYNSCIQ